MYVSPSVVTNGTFTLPSTFIPLHHSPSTLHFPTSLPSTTAELAQAVVDAGAVPLLVLCIQEPEVSLKRVSASALSDICKHSPEVRGREGQDNSKAFMAICPAVVTCLFIITFSLPHPLTPSHPHSLTSSPLTASPDSGGCGSHSSSGTAHCQ